MSRTDDIMKAVLDELERSRDMLDNGPSPITSVMILVLMSERTGKPLKTIVRPESQRVVSGTEGELT